MRIEDGGLRRLTPVSRGLKLDFASSCQIHVSSFGLGSGKHAMFSIGRMQDMVNSGRFVLTWTLCTG